MQPWVAIERRDHVQNPLDNEPTQQAIHVISSGVTLAGDSSFSQKAYACLAYQVNYEEEIKENEDPITFTPDDQGYVILLHNDLLVILVVVTKHPIGRNLVNSGSSISLIYWNCFELVSIAHDQLK